MQTNLTSNLASTIDTKIYHTGEFSMWFFRRLPAASVRLSAARIRIPAATALFSSKITFAIPAKTCYCDYRKDLFKVGMIIHRQ
jgi:hypothetical protein